MDEWFKDWFDADYAALYAHRNDEEAEQAVRMALAVAPELGLGPVLDLACGTGRHLAPLRLRNPLAFGLDLSKTLLEEAALQLRPWLLRGDMRQLPVKPGVLSGITLWFTPFGYFSDATNAELLCRLSTLLRPGGALLLDFLNTEHLTQTLVPENTLEQGGIRVHSLRTIEGDRIVKRMTVTRLREGTARQVVESIRLYSSQELRSMAAHAGLQCHAEVGDYAGSSFVPRASPRWIGILRKNFKP